MPYLSASAVVIHYKEALYQVHAPLPFFYLYRLTGGGCCYISLCSPFVILVCHFNLCQCQPWSTFHSSATVSRCLIFVFQQCRRLETNNRLMIDRQQLSMYLCSQLASHIHTSRHCTTHLILYIRSQCLLVTSRNS